MIIIKDKGHNSQVYIARSNAAMDKSNVDENRKLVDETLLLQTLKAYATLSDLNNKQDTLQSGITIKTINNNTILGAGNIELLTHNDMVQYVNEVVGRINNTLTEIIG